MEPMSDDYQNEDELPDNQFIIMWDNTGLECIIPFDSFKAGEGGDMLAKLEGGENTNECGRSQIQRRKRDLC